MLPPKPIRRDISAESVRLAAKGLNDAATTRLSAIAHLLEGLPCKEAAGKAGCSVRSLNRWIDDFNKGGLERLQAMRRGRRRANDLNTDMTPDEIRQAADWLDWPVKIRCLAIASLLEGVSQEGVASMANRSRKTIRCWMRNFNKAGIEGLMVPERQNRKRS